MAGMRVARRVPPAGRLRPAERDVQAEVTFLRTEEGGIDSPVRADSFPSPFTGR